MTKYRIGEIADMLGVSPEAVRFFEKQGLIHPVRDPESGYRVYEAGEHNILMRARGYSRYGFTLTESSDLIAQCDLEDLSSAFKDRAAALEESLHQQYLLLHYLKQHQRHIERVSSMLGCCVIERSPAMYGILYRRNQSICEDGVLRKQIRQWSDKKPLAETLMVYPKEKLLEGRDGYLMGLCMEEELACKLSMGHGAGVLYFPSQKAVYTIERIPHSYAVRPNISQTFRNALRFLRENHLTIAADSYGRTLHTSKKNGEYVHYCEQWFPIR